METIGLILAFVLILGGLVGTLVPILPGLPVIYLGYLVWGLASGWKDFGLWTMMILGVITLGTLALDYYAGVAGAKRFGASRAGVVGAVLGTILGFIVFSVPGLILGPMLGAVLGELIAGKSARNALKAGLGAFLGFLAGGLFKLMVAFSMTGLFIFRVIF